MNISEYCRELIELEVLFIRYSRRDNENLGFIRGSSKYGDQLFYLRDKITSNCPHNHPLVTRINNLAFEFPREYLDMSYGTLTPSYTELFLDNIRLNHMLSLEDLTTINYVTSKLNISQTTIKAACRHGRLLNTKKVGNTWLVSFTECYNLWDENSGS